MNYYEFGVSKTVPKESALLNLDDASILKKFPEQLELYVLSASEAQSLNKFRKS